MAGAVPGRLGKRVFVPSADAGVAWELGAVDPYGRLKFGTLGCAKGEAAVVALLFAPGLGEGILTTNDLPFGVTDLAVARRRGENTEEAGENTGKGRFVALIDGPAEAFSLTVILSCTSSSAATGSSYCWHTARPTSSFSSLDLVMYRRSLSSVESDASLSTSSSVSRAIASGESNVSSSSNKQDSMPSVMTLSTNVLIATL